MRTALFLTLSLAAVLGTRAWATARFMDYELQLAEAHADATMAYDTMINMASDGRWIRAYDPKTGHNSYRFAPGQRGPAKHLVAAAQQ